MEKTNSNIKNGTFKTLAISALLAGTALVSLGAAAAVPGAHAAKSDGSGDFDTTFGDGGAVVTDFGSDLDTAEGMVIQSDGKIVLAGSSWQQPDSKPRFTLARYTSSGALDNAFGSGGKVVSNLIGTDQDYSQAYGIAQQSDGKLVVVGTAWNPPVYHDTFAVVRYNTDGTPDANFGTNGVVLTQVYNDTGMGPEDDAQGVAIQPDGKIVVVGYTGNIFMDFAMVRYNSDGSLDQSFGTGGKVTTDMGSDDRAHSVKLQADGKILVGGYGGSTGGEWTLARYNTDGSLDNSFGSGGKVFSSFLSGVDWGYDVTTLPNGKILMGGFAQIGSYVCGGYICKRYGFAAAQYNIDGTPDASFGDDNGKVSYDLVGSAQAYAMARRADGKIVLAGAINNDDFEVMVLQPDGSPDAGFQGGAVTANFGGQDRAYAVAIQADGKVVVAGQVVNSTTGSNYDFGMVRYILDMGGNPAPTATQVPGGATATPTHGTGGGPSATPTHGTGGGPTATATTNPSGCQISFSDVPAGSTFYQYVQCLACKGIISGYGDGTFRTNAEVTRGQLSKIVSNAAGFNDPISGQTFTDVTSGQPYYTFIERLARRGIIGGYTDGTFRPNANATRGQIAKIVSNAAGINDPVSGQTFSDVPTTSPYYAYIERMSSHNIIGGYTDGTFRPNNNATRGQVAKIVSGTFFPNCSTAGKDGK